jgi:hypothetical protein
MLRCENPLLNQFQYVTARKTLICDILDTRHTFCVVHVGVRHRILGIMWRILPYAPQNCFFRIFEFFAFLYYIQVLYRKYKLHDTLTNVHHYII